MHLTRTHTRTHTITKLSGSHRHHPCQAKPNAGRDLGPALRLAGAELSYETQRGHQWWVLKDGRTYPLNCFEYADGVWRIALTRYNCFSNVRYDVVSRLGEKNVSALELSFLPPELNDVTKYVFDHLVAPVTVVPSTWLDSVHATEHMLGKPLRGYYWTCAATEFYKHREIRRSRR